MCIVHELFLFILLLLLPVTPFTDSVTSVFFFCYLLEKRGCVWNEGKGEGVAVFLCSSEARQSRHFGPTGCHL